MRTLFFILLTTMFAGCASDASSRYKTKVSAQIHSDFDEKNRGTLSIEISG